MQLYTGRTAFSSTRCGIEVLAVIHISKVLKVLFEVAGKIEKTVSGQTVFA